MPRRRTSSRLARPRRCLLSALETAVAHSGAIASSAVSSQSFRFPDSDFLLLSVSIPSLIACLLSGFLLQPNLIHHYQRLDYSTTIIISSV
jgi:hypothetical protein